MPTARRYGSFTDASWPPLVVQAVGAASRFPAIYKAFMSYGFHRWRHDLAGVPATSAIPTPDGSRERCHAARAVYHQDDGISRFAGILERMMGLEPTTFCMASRRSSQLSYIRGARPV